MRDRFAFMVILAVVTVAVGACSPSNEEASTVTTTPTSATTEPTTEPTTSEQAATTAPTQQVITVTVADGTVTPPPATVNVKLGSTVVIEVTTDHADDIHVHGYDITQPAPAGAPARVEVQASIPGQFEVELEHDHVLLVTLSVQ